MQDYFHNDLISVKQGLNHNYETGQIINVFYYIQATGDDINMHSRFDIVIMYKEYYMT
jgi:hypothetical protein